MNRRRFMKQAAVAGCAVSLPAISGCLSQNASGHRVAVGDNARQSTAPVTVLLQGDSSSSNPRRKAWLYITEILQRAGIFFAAIEPAQLAPMPPRSQTLLVLAGDLALTTPQRSFVTDWVKAGGALLGIGGTSGLNEVFGVSGQTPLAEGWLKVTSSAHPVLEGLRSSLHVFGGNTLKTSTGTSLADVGLWNGASKGAALVENQYGQGRTLLLGPDLLFSVVHMQQGLPVLQDGKPPADDSAPLNEGMLKAEDGLVLDWQRDRVPAIEGGVPIFLEPVSDELRELIVRSLFHLARNQGLAMPVLWYWPKLLPAVAMMSHDTDGNEPAKAPALLDVMNRAGLKSTWCILYPGGYPREFYRQLADQQFEIALHYDAMTGAPRTSWSSENFLFQLNWLKQHTGISQIVTNKNHYTRWEGRLDFFRWCEAAGLGADQTRGPSKKGTIGFPLGGSQPYFPLDDEGERTRYINVLEVNLLTQDLVITCPPEYGRALCDSVLRHHGVAHFLFHPAHIQKPGVADALQNTVDYARSTGMEWWTCRQVVEWERIRRRVTLSAYGPGSLTLTAPQPLAEATILVLRTGARSPAPSGNAKTLASAKAFEFDAHKLNLSGNTEVRF